MNKLLLALMSIVVLNMSAQHKEVTAKFEIYLDNKKVETDSVFVGTITDTKLTKITDSFTTFLLPNSVQDVIITHPRYSKKTINIDTRGKQDILVKVYLEAIRDDLRDY